MNPIEYTAQVTGNFNDAYCRGQFTQSDWWAFSALVSLFILAFIYSAWRDAQ
jgi:hypothetical protein